MPFLHFRVLVLGITVIAAAGFAIYQSFRQQEEPFQNGRISPPIIIPPTNPPRRRRRQNSSSTYGSSHSRRSSTISSTDSLNGSQTSTLECTICLETIGSGQQKRVFRCSHIFHTICVSKWLKSNNSCPNCRILI